MIRKFVDSGFIWLIQLLLFLDSLHSLVLFSASIELNIKIKSTQGDYDEEYKNGAKYYQEDNPWTHHISLAGEFILDFGIGRQHFLVVLFGIFRVLGVWVGGTFGSEGGGGVFRFTSGIVSVRVFADFDGSILVAL